MVNDKWIDLEKTVLKTVDPHVQEAIQFGFYSGARAVTTEFFEVLKTMDRNDPHAFAAAWNSRVDEIKDYFDTLEIKIQAGQSPTIVRNDNER